MDRRFFLALLLSGIVVILTPRFFPGARVVSPPAGSATGVPAAAPGGSPSGVPGGAPTIGAMPAASPTASSATSGSGTAPSQAATAAAAETLSIGNALTTLRISAAGGQLLAVDLPLYRQLGGREGTVQLSDVAPLLRHRLIAGGDTIHLDRLVFTRSATPDTTSTLQLGAAVGSGRVDIGYTIAPDNYVTDVRVRASGLPGPVFLLTDLPQGFRSQEADSLEDHRHLAYALKPEFDGAARVDFRSPDPGERILRPGPLTWAVAKSKYFVVGVLARADTASPFAELQVTGAPRTSKIPSRAFATVVTPLGADGVHFEVYAGPQEWERLVAMGRSFENTNPYGGVVLGSVVQPFATIVMRLLLWAKRTTALEYGWILVLFGIAIRIAMWPLNSRMMRSSLAMQRVAPLVQAAQQQHKGDVEKQREAVMRIYKENNVSPFAMFSGCLPILATMPILIALFFVFQNTIEFRGVSFMWLPDITLKDPYYILPLAMGASMYALSWLSMRNVPPNPQAKMMSWMMPLIMVAFLFNFASGLNLYYTVQNLAALPQQWLISNERGKALAKQSAKAPAATDGGQRKRG